MTINQEQIKNKIQNVKEVVATMDDLKEKFPSEWLYNCLMIVCKEYYESLNRDSESNINYNPSVSRNHNVPPDNHQIINHTIHQRLSEIVTFMDQNDIEFIKKN